MKNLILINGAPNTGKDTLAQLIIDDFEGSAITAHLKLASPIHAIMGVLLNEPTFKKYMGAVKSNDHKTDVSYLSENWRSVRELCILTGEQFVKPVFGQGYFAVHLAERIQTHARQTHAIQNQALANKLGFDGEADFDFAFVVSDLGFQVELDVLLEKLPDWKITLVNLTRDGCNYNSDSRGLVQSSEVARCAVHNTTKQSLADAAHFVKTLVTSEVKIHT